MPERSLKCEYIRMTFLLILSCKRDFFFSFCGKLLFKSALPEVSLLHVFVHLSLDELITFRVR